MIISWERMAARLKAEFLPSDYEVQVYRKMQSFKQREVDVSAYTEEFHRLSLRCKNQESESRKVERYINGLKYNLQDEISIMAPETFSKCFQMALRAEEKLKRKSEQQNRGRGSKNFRGRGDRKQPQKGQGESN